MKKQTLCLIFGGKSREYSVSLKSCGCILKHINREKFEIHKIGITEEGKWYVYCGDECLIENGEWISSTEKYPVSLFVNTGEITYFCYGEEKRIKPDTVFPIIHGAYGEDGVLHSVFDVMGIRCLGCNNEAGALTVNKYLTKLIAKENGVPVADFFILNKSSTYTESEIYKRAEKIGYPLFVKAVSSGSSVGVYRVENRNSLTLCIEKALEISNSVLVEKSISGVETEIAILERNGEIILGKIGQIEYEGDFYDYKAKYQSSSTRLVIPAKIGEECENLIKEYAKTLFRATGCHGMCRADFFVTKEDEVIFNELNTVPGFTSGSMYPLLMTDSACSLSDLIDIICL
ncbi:MAG: D-alanine--D-alanine ligase [Clostridia bacterium]|nr:D-alanine--D-alanine ligase [Clostridia bacterium]